VRHWNCAAERLQRVSLKAEISLIAGKPAMREIFLSEAAAKFFSAETAF
jgi:hypothetical protein